MRSIIGLDDGTARPDLECAHGGARPGGCVATRCSEGFLVYAGSTAAPAEVPSLGDYVRKLRGVLRESGVLIADGPCLRLTQDYTFTSPSMASAAMLARSSNGRADWKDDHGRSLKEIQQLAAAG